MEHGLTLEQLAEQAHFFKSALGSYEGENFKDISHYALIELAKFYEVTVDYLLGRSETKNHPNADLADLHLSDNMIELLKSGLVDNSLLCELAVHPDFPRFMADLEIYVNGVAVKMCIRDRIHRFPNWKIAPTWFLPIRYLSFGLTLSVQQLASRFLPYLPLK